MTGFTLMAYGPAKTGNTSLAAHAQAHLAETKFYGYGPYNATRRLHAAMPLLEELSADEVAQLSLIHGHGVAFSTLAALPDNDVALYLVCRHPFDRFVSAYKHYLRHRREEIPLDASTFLEQQPPSPIASAVMARFAPLADPDATTEQERLISILQCMRFLLATECLNDMSVALFSSIGVPPLGSKRRVQNETADLGVVTDRSILDRDHLDLIMFQAVMDAWKSARSGGEPPHPFGYRPERLAAARRLLSGAGHQRKELINRAYFDLFDFHGKTGRLHATSVFLGAAGRQPAREAFAAYCAERSPDLRFDDLPARDWCFVADAHGLLGDASAQRRATEAALALDPGNPRANFSMGRLAARSAELDLAVRHLNVAVQVNPVMQEAWSWLARTHLKRRDRGAAMTAIDRAVALNPSSERIRKLRDVIAGNRPRRAADG